MRCNIDSTHQPSARVEIENPCFDEVAQALGACAQHKRVPAVIVQHLIEMLDRLGDGGRALHFVIVEKDGLGHAARTGVQTDVREQLT